MNDVELYEAVLGIEQPWRVADVKLDLAIQAIKARGRGYRNRKNFKTAIYFALSGLDLYPRLPAES